MRSWYGCLTGETLEEVANECRERFEGKHFTMVHVHELFQWRPEVRTGQKLQNPITTHTKHFPDGSYLGGIDWHDSYGVLLVLSTYTERGRHMKTHHEAHAPHECPYVSFEHNTMSIASTNLEGHTTLTKVVVEANGGWSELTRLCDGLEGLMASLDDSPKSFYKRVGEMIRDVRMDMR